MSLSLFGAFIGGVLTLLSPCSVMLLPAFFAYAFTSPGALLARTGVFFIGLVSAMVPLGILAGTVGAWVSRFRFELVTGASVLVILLGLLLAIGLPLPGPLRQRGLASASAASVFALGTVYGLAGVCAGPMLGAALSYAAFGGSAAAGGLVLFVFSIGMTLPLVVLALLWDRVPAARWLARPRELVIGRFRNTWTNAIGGVLTMGVGVLLLVSRGTTMFGGVLGASAQAALEADAMRVTAGVPDWITALVFVALAGLAAAGILASSGTRRAADARAARGRAAGEAHAAGGSAEKR